MLMFIFLQFFIIIVYGYFTLPGNCPEKVVLQEDFVVNLFTGKWYQVYHYSSDELNNNNCANLQLLDESSAGVMNFSRIDSDNVLRHSMGAISQPWNHEDERSKLDVTFTYNRVPKKLRKRTYPFRVLATNYDYFATVYTCSYSPKLNKHYIYVWILSKIPLLADIYKDLAVRPLNQIGVASTRLVRDDWTNCEAKSFSSAPVEPLTFRFPITTHIRLSEYHEKNIRKDSYY